QFQKKTHFPATSIILSVSKVNTDTYTVALPSEDFYGPELSSQANREIEALSSSNKVMAGQIAALNSEKDSILNRLKNARVVHTTTWSSGEPNIFPGPRFNSAAPNDYQSYVNSQCANHPLPPGAAQWLGQNFTLHSYTGGPHGTTFYVGTCLAK
ncbi:MAG: hypothetical protein ABWY27_08800, partial [Telluria sp.]